MSVTDLDEYRVKRRLRRAAEEAERISSLNDTLSSCIYCGATYRYGDRREHRCDRPDEAAQAEIEAEMDRHPSRS